MITQFRFDGAQLKRVDRDVLKIDPKVPCWIDLLKPEASEIAGVDERLSLHLPDLEEMSEIEVSSRLYEEDGAYFMTFVYVADALGDNPETTPFTLVLKDNLLVTIRYRDMRVVSHFMAKAEDRGINCPKNNTALLLAILENIIDLWADAVEKGHVEIETESKNIFGGETSSKDHRGSMRKIAKIADLNSKMRECLGSLNRVLIFINHMLEETKAPKDAISKLRTLMADNQSLLDHAGFVSTKISFVLDATLGLVNIEQNAIIKIFSVAAVIFLPPTLVASIYGMNFKHMPELDWVGGYPFAVVLMILSAIVPYWWFKRRGWL